MPDERVSIVGTLDGNLPKGLEQIAASATRVDKSITVADKDLNLFRHSLEAIGTHIKDLEKANLTPVPQALQESAAAADSFDQAQGRVVARSAKLVQRILSLQLALQTIASQGPGSFGQYQTSVDAGTQAMGSFASVASLFPNQFGLIAGAVAAATAGISVFYQKAIQAEAALKAVKEQIVTDRKDLAAQRGKAVLEQLISGDVELTKTKQALEETKKSAEEAFGRVEDARTRLKLAEAQGNKVAAALASFDLDKAASDAQKLLESFNKLDNEIKKREGIAKIAENLKELDAQLEETEEKLKLELITPLEAVEEKARIAGERLKQAFALSRILPTSKDFKATVKEQVEDQKKVTEELEQQQAAKEEMENLDRLEKEQIDEKLDKSTKAGKETNDLYTGIAQGIGQAFAQATDSLIDGLVTGKLNAREFAGQFLLQISKMIAQALVLKAVMAGLGVIGLNSGGEVPIKRADGGPIPGPNVNADVVPAMLTPGEFVVRKSAVDLYGKSAMHALNRGMIPPGLLSTAALSTTRSVSGHFAGGGEVPYGAGATPKPAVAFVMSSDSEVDRLTAGGDGAMIRFFERNRAKIRTAIGIGGR